MRDVTRHSIQKKTKEAKLWAAKNGYTHLYFSDHFYDRMHERGLDDCMSFIYGAVKHMYENVFTQNTYNLRKYKVMFCKLQIAISFGIGALSGERRMIVTTVFPNETSYECDEVIHLK